MSQNNHNQDDPTQASPPRSPQSGQQGKLVLGNFGEPQNGPPAQRRPTQYNNPQPPLQPTRPAQQPGPYQQPGSYQQRQGQPGIPNPPNPPYNSQAPYAPPGAPGTPQQPGSFAPNTRGSGMARRRKGRPRGCAIGCISVLVIFVILAVFAFSSLQRVLAFGSAVSTKAPLTTETSYMGTADRTNLLIMGYGGSGHDGGLLTDSLLVVSMLPKTQHTSLVSVPRDLWVRVTTNPDNYGKINSLYEFASNNGKDRVTGGDAVAKKVSTITGLDVKYWMSIDFHGFRDLINSIGGVDIDVKAAFTAQYPKNDNPNIDASWITVKFKKGLQHMDGETAIRYSRAREVLDNPAEGTDYARSARQQIVVKAALSKIKQSSTWPKLFDAMNALQKTIYTNMSLVDLGLFSQKMDLNDPKAAKIGLSTANVLEEDGYFNLHPANGNWDTIPAYVKKNLYA